MLLDTYFSDLSCGCKVSSVRELGNMRLQLANFSRQAVTACLDVAGRSDTVIDPSTGESIVVGSLEQVGVLYNSVGVCITYSIYSTI